MSNDSENKVMTKIFSLHLIEGGRFLLFICLFIHLQMVQAVYRPNEDISKDSSIQTDRMFISTETVIAGMEHVFISHPEKKREQRQFKRKSPITKSKKRNRKKQNFSSDRSKTSEIIFSFKQNKKTERSLLTISGNGKQIFSPVQYIIKSLLIKTENSVLILIYLLGIFFKIIYKSHWFSSLRFFKNFKRPPPKYFKIEVLFN